MLWLKSCPRCQGDMFLDRDFYGSYVSCLQCGYVLDHEEEAFQGEGGGLAAAWDEGPVLRRIRLARKVAA